MKLADRYRRASDLPTRIPVFPLRGAILLPRTSLPLNIFEPRYLQMIEDVIGGSRVLGIVQPDSTTQGESPSGSSVPVRKTGAVGRLTAYQELEDGRIVMSLAGICRFHIVAEAAVPTPYRMFDVDYAPFASDFGSDGTEDAVDRDTLLSTLKAYLAARDLRADWGSIGEASNEALVNGLSIMSPYAPEEKQALLEATTLKSRAEILVTLAQMELAAGAGGTGTTLQ